MPSMILVVVIAALMLMMSQSQSFAPQLPLVATVGAIRPLATSGRRNAISFTEHRASRISLPLGPKSSREARRQGRDPLKPHRAIVGRGVYTPLHIYLRSILLLFLLVVGIGMAIAGVTLLLIASGRFLLEFLAG